MNGLITRDGADYLFNLFTNGETAVSSYWVALITGAQPGISISGDELDEPAAGDYLRGELLNESGNWYIDSGVLINLAEIYFPVPATAWGDVRHWAICDQQIGGRALFVGSFDDIFTVVVDEQPYIGATALSVDLGLSEWNVEE